MKRRFFGTDGIRGVANTYPMTVEMAVSVGKAVASYFDAGGGAPLILIGKDTRVSGDMLSAALAAGVCAVGGDVMLAGTVPTPAVAYLTRSSKAAAGIVISASHNPFFDNGIKVFGPNGYKLSDTAETELEKTLLETDWESAVDGKQETGRIGVDDSGAARYMEFLEKRMPTGFSLAGIRLVLDCANGATFAVAPRLFANFGAAVETLFDRPNGRNINDQCGSQHPDTMARRVVETGAVAGLAFDGDGDRLIVVDETGQVLSGDQIIAVIANHMKKKGTLTGNRVVTTVMSNVGLKAALRRIGVDHLESDVGDRHVLEQMIRSGAVVGGEDSGHMIFLEHHTTGDGILAALQLMQVVVESQAPLSVLKQVMHVFPQVLINVEVREKPELHTLDKVRRIILETEEDLGNRGRVLVRYSGTQAICRVMVEAQTEAETQAYCLKIADAIQESIGLRN